VLRGAHERAGAPAARRSWTARGAPGRRDDREVPAPEARSEDDLGSGEPRRLGHPRPWACSGEVAIALAFDTIDFGWFCSTQPDIALYGLVLLTDDLDTQPAENLAPVVRNDLIAQLDGGVDALSNIHDPISALVTTEVLTDLGAKVAVEQLEIAKVTREFLAGSGPTD
jgi:hypothetical protein